MISAACLPLHSLLKGRRVTNTHNEPLRAVNVTPVDRFQRRAGWRVQLNVITRSSELNFPLLSPVSPVVILGQFPGFLSLVFVSSTGLVQRLSPVPDDTDVGAEVVLLGGGGQGEGVPLQPGDGRTLDEDVLTHLHTEAFLLHLQLQSLGGVHHHL